MKQYIYVVFALALLSIVKCAHESVCDSPVAVTGTPVSLCPPPDFDLKLESGGFQHRSKPASIMIMEIPEPFEKTAPELADKKLSVQRIKLLSKKDIEVNGKKGILCNVHKESGGTVLEQWILLLPNGKTSITVNGTFLKNDEQQLSRIIKEALLSVHIDTNAVRDEKVLSFDFGPELGETSLKLAKVLQGPSVAYNEEGAWPSPSSEEFSFFAGPSLTDPFLVPGKEILQAQMQQLCKHCSYQPHSIASVTIDTLKGFEVAAFSTDEKNNSMTLKYLVVLFDKNMYYLMVGTASQEHEKNLEAFRKISHSFRRKSDSSCCKI